VQEEESKAFFEQLGHYNQQYEVTITRSPLYISLLPARCQFPALSFALESYYQAKKRTHSLSCAITINMHTIAHTHTNMHTLAHTHTHTHTRTHTHIHTHTHTHTHTHIRKHTHANAHTRMHAHAHTHIHIQSLLCTRSLSCKTPTHTHNKHTNAELLSWEDTS